MSTVDQGIKKNSGIPVSKISSRHNELNNLFNTFSKHQEQFLIAEIVVCEGFFFWHVSQLNCKSVFFFN